MESALDYWSARALLEWQIELGATEALAEAPVDRYQLQQAAPKSATKPAAPEIIRPKEIDPVTEARAVAAKAMDLEQLRVLMDRFEHCDLKKGARNLVFADGTPGARVMIIGGAPGRVEDQQGTPFVGRSGPLLDRMLAAIDLARTDGVYITNVLPWRPPQDRDPSPLEIATMTPFLERHVALAQPEILVLMGNTSCQAVLGKRGITRLRGDWAQAWGKPVLPMLHPDDLLGKPKQKRDSWADLLELKARLLSG